MRVVVGIYCVGSYHRLRQSCVTYVWKKEEREREGEIGGGEEETKGEGGRVRMRRERR